MAKILCVLYDDPVDGYPPRYARDDLPKIERYPDGQTLPTPKAIDFRPGELLGSVSGELGLRVAGVERVHVPGDAVVVPADVPHAARNAGDIDVHVLVDELRACLDGVGVGAHGVGPGAAILQRRAW